MKRKIFFWAAVCVAAALQAKVLRVNNVSGMAPYASIQDAVDAAQDGDTIMVDGSTVRYDGATIDKQLVVVGPGYLLNKNGLSAELADAVINNWLNLEKEGIALIGLHINDRVNVKAPKVVITRCQISYDNLEFERDANNSIIHQNYFSNAGIHFNQSQNHQVTNNIFQSMQVRDPHNSYVAYNTCYGTGGSFESVPGSANRVERNIVHREGWDDEPDNTYSDNLLVDFDFFGGTDTDKDVFERTMELPDNAGNVYGAFAGTDPYVLSGIPAGPVIEELTVPASVEEGSKLNVTIKLGLQK